MNKSYRRICPKCWEQTTKKDGIRKGRQSYRCWNCAHVRIRPARRKAGIDPERIYQDFSLHKQTYRELADTHGISIRTVQRYLDAYTIPLAEPPQPTQIVLLIDTTYFGDTGIMLFKDAGSKDVLHVEIVAYETNEGYRRWVQYLQEQWRIIRAIVSDGRRGLLGWFWGIPTQMCQYHQSQIIRRYITKNPLLPPNRELQGIVKRLYRTDKESFQSRLDNRCQKHRTFLLERGRNSKGKSYYIHKRTRSAYYSLKRNLPYLFVYLEYLEEIDIPNTTNGIESVFSHLKYKVNLHRWLSLPRKIKLIQYLLHSRK